MSGRRPTQVAEAIAHCAGDFLERESNHRSLVTATRADVSPDLKNVMVYLSILPHTFEDEVLSFAKRQRSNFRQYVKKHITLRFLPTIDFAIDYGEKNRQRIDDLTRR